MVFSFALFSSSHYCWFVFFLFAHPRLFTVDQGDYSNVYARVRIHQEDAAGQLSQTVFQQLTTTQAPPPFVQVAGPRALVQVEADNNNKWNFQLRYWSQYRGVRCDAAPLNLATPWGWFTEPSNGQGLTPGDNCSWAIQRTEPINLYVANISLPAGAVLTVWDPAAAVATAFTGPTVIAYAPPIRR